MSPKKNPPSLSSQKLAPNNGKQQVSGENGVASNAPDSPTYFPEDERSPMEREDDHSHDDLDLDAEIEKSLSRRTSSSAPVPSISSAPDASQIRGGGHDVHAEYYYPEDDRPCYDGEEDHSHSDFDIDAEIEAKLGKATDDDDSARTHAKDEQPATESSTGSPHRVPVPSGAGPEASSEFEAPHDSAPPDDDDLYYYPEDDRPHYGWESDHSQIEIDIDAEIDSQLSKRQALRNSWPVKGDSGGNSSTDPVDDEHFHEDERSPLEHEDDHSDVDADHSVNITESAVSMNTVSTDNGVAAATSSMHPDLAASFAAARAFADQEEVQQEPSKSSADSGETTGGTPETDSPETTGDAENVDGSLSESGNLSIDTSEAVVPGIASTTVSSESDDNADSESTATASETAESDINASDAVEMDSPPPSPPADAAQEETNDDEGDADDQPMSLRDHLRDLRKRVLRAFLFMLAGFLICYPFAERLFGLLVEPLVKAMPKTSTFIFTNPPEAFFTYLKVAFVAGIFLASPLVFYQIWAFIAPGLYKEEKLYIIPVAFCSALFFTLGGAFCYFIGLPFVFEFFMSYNTGLIQAMPSLKETLSFVLQLLLAFGLVFELPLFIFFLSRLGIVTADMMRRFRRYSVLVNIIVAAILTPPDVMSQLLMAGPLIILYEISIIIAAVFGKKKPVERADEDEDDEEEEDDTPASSDKA